MQNAIDSIPSSGNDSKDLYLHLYFFGKNSFSTCCCKIYSSSSTAYTFEQLKNFLSTNGHTSTDTCYPAQGTFNFVSFYWRKTNTGSKTQWYYGRPVNGVYVSGNTLYVVADNTDSISISNFLQTSVIKVASAGNKLYMHNISTLSSGYAALNGHLITDSSTPFTYATFNTFLRNNSFTTNKNWFPLSGIRASTNLYYYSSSSQSVLKI